MYKEVRAPFFYYGGKGKVRSKIVSLLPEHDRYIEVFGGAGSVLLGKAPAKFEVFNDIADEIYEFFKCLQDEKELEKLERRLDFTIFSRSLFEEWRVKRIEDIPELHLRAYRTFVIANMSHGGKLQKVTASDFRVGMAESPAHHFRSKVANLSYVVERFKRVFLENMDFEWVIRKYDKPGVLMYLDPPYCLETRKRSKRTTYGKYEMEPSSHERLVEILKTAKSNIVLSGYDTPLYTSLGWKKVDLVSRCSMDFETAGSIKTETVWLNF